MPIVGVTFSFTPTILHTSKVAKLFIGWSKYSVFG